MRQKPKQHSHDWLPVVFAALSIGDKRYVIVEIPCDVIGCDAKEWQIVEQEEW